MKPIWQSEIEVDVCLAKQLIEKQFSDLPVQTILPAGEGFDNTVFQVNDNYLFRFPRRKVAVDLIETEGKLLPTLGKQLPLPIPMPIFFGKRSKHYPWPFLGYDFIVGCSPTNISNEKRNQSVRQMAHFLKELHSFPVEEAVSLGVKADFLGRTNRKKRKLILRERVDKLVDKKYLDQDLQGKLIQFVDNVPELEPSSTVIHTLVHGDLHTRNLLMNHENEICGVIDWGDVHIGHPAVDLSIAFSFFPPDSREEFFNRYGEVEQETKDIAQFVAVHIAMVLLLYGKDKGNSSLIAGAYESLRLALET